MPGLAWLATHPSSGDVWPWWTDYALLGMALALAALPVVVGVALWRERRARLRSQARGR